MRYVLVFLSLTLMASAAAAASADEEVRQSEKKWAAAVVARDFAALDKLLGARLIYAHSTGVVETKSQYLERLRKGLQRYDEIGPDGMTVEVYGKTGVVQGKLRMRGSGDGKPFDDPVMYLHVWVREGANWQLVGHQTTKLR